jgi:hypothetical protein
VQLAFLHCGIRVPNAVAAAAEIFPATAVEKRSRLRHTFFGHKTLQVE